MIPIYALVAWLSTYYYKHAVYFDVLGDCYEAFTIAAFFALLCHYIAADLHSQKDYFRGIQPKNWVWPVNWLQKCSGGKKGIWRVVCSGCLGWRVSVLPFARTDDHSRSRHTEIRCILRAVSQSGLRAYLGRYILDTFVITVLTPLKVLAIECVAVTIAMYCLIQFYIQIKDEISEYSPFLKILSIKLVIFLSFWQTVSINLTFHFSN
jgi:hypothetical protein